MGSYASIGQVCAVKVGSRKIVCKRNLSCGSQTTVVCKIKQIMRVFVFSCLWSLKGYENRSGLNKIYT